MFFKNYWVKKLEYMYLGLVNFSIFVALINIFTNTEWL